MQQIGLWHITNNIPVKLNSGTIDLEKHLEAWLEHDPSMLQAGLTIVGRQVRVQGGIIDLLALDPQGRWVVIEVKPGTLYREVIAQALDYASCVATMPSRDLIQKANSYLATHQQSSILPFASFVEEAANQPGSREVVVYVVGAGRDPSLERVLSFLSGKHSVPVSVISFHVFEVPGGHKVLLRELSESETAEPSAPTSTLSPILSAPSSVNNDSKLEKLCSMAVQNGIGPQFQALLDAARKHNFYPRAYSQAVMYTPPNNRTRMLYTVRASVDQPGMVTVYVSPYPFVEFYNLNLERTQQAIGPNGWKHLSPADVDTFIVGLDDLLENAK